MQDDAAALCDLGHLLGVSGRVSEAKRRFQQVDVSPRVVCRKDGRSNHARIEGGEDDFVPEPSTLDGSLRLGTPSRRFRPRLGGQATLPAGSNPLAVHIRSAPPSEGIYCLRASAVCEDSGCPLLDHGR